MLVDGAGDICVKGVVATGPPIPTIEGLGDGGEVMDWFANNTLEFCMNKSILLTLSSSSKNIPR